MNNAVEQIKERLDIVDVIGSYVQLQKAGRHFKGKSPFTNEKTPSFFVSPDRGMYYCFSSGKGGDIFRFIEEMEGVDFKGALKILAERAHVELTPQDPKKQTEREALHALIEAATAYFAMMLGRHEEVREYLHTRGVTDQSIAKWRIGFVPDGWRNLRDHLAEKGFTDALMVRAGLIKHAAEGTKLYDVFRDRVMFPIADSAGRIVAFSGRAMGSDPALPKYVNSPETELYEKSHILFGYHLAKQSIRTSNFSLIVEGQFDLVLAHQAGFKNTVAISGTALSIHHTDLLSRLSQRVVLALDGDRAGINSVQRAAYIMLPRGMDVKVALLPEGKDPADLVATDPALLKTAVREALTVVEFFVTILKQTTRDERAFRLSVRDQVLPLMLRIPSRIDREHFEQVVSVALGTTKDAVHSELERIAQGQTRGDAETVPPPTPPVGGVGGDTPAPPPSFAYRTDELVRFIYGAILWWEQEREKLDDGAPKETLDTSMLRAALTDILGENGWKNATDLSEEETNKLLFEAEVYCAPVSVTELRKTLLSTITELEERVLKQALHEAREGLRHAEGTGEEEAQRVALERCAELQRRLSTIGSRFTER